MNTGESLRHRGVSGAFWAEAKPLMGSISRYIDCLRNDLLDSKVWDDGLAAEGPWRGFY